MGPTTKNGDSDMSRTPPLDMNDPQWSGDAGKAAREANASSMVTPGQVESQTAAFLKACPEMAVYKEPHEGYPGAS